MKSFRLEIPAGQNWSCHGCTDCCRNHLVVPLLPEDKKRIEKQKWTIEDGVDPAAMFVARINHHRLGHQADGACVFLEKSGRCRIHAKFGESAKPLACRLYPLVIYPAGDKVLAGLRFNCPSAAASRGKPLTEQGDDIRDLAEDVLPSDHKSIPPPPVVNAPGLEWPDFLRFRDWLDFTLVAKDAPISLKLLRALYWLEGLEKSSFDHIAGETADEILEALVQGAAKKMPTLPATAENPSAFGRLFLRLMVLDHARNTTVADQSSRSPHRWKMMLAAFSFMWSSGRTPALREELKSVPFADVEKSFGPLSPESEALLSRYFRVKIQSLQFCGKAFYDRPLVEGFRNLALLYPVIIWLARWLAVSAGRTELGDADLLKAVSLVDCQYGYTPYLAWRTRLLQQRNDIVRLCGWYAR